MAVPRKSASLVRGPTPDHTSPLSEPVFLPLTGIKAISTPSMLTAARGSFGHTDVTLSVPLSNGSSLTLSTQRTPSHPPLCSPRRGPPACSALSLLGPLWDAVARKNNLGPSQNLWGRHELRRVLDIPWPLQIGPGA